jgi:hypothetical protein
MREELARLTAGVIAGIDTDAAPKLTNDETSAIVAAANLVTQARTATRQDYRGDVIDAHAPELPTRFTKQLTQLFRGAVVIGMDRDAALRLVIRCARDSVPPPRSRIIEDLAENPESTTTDVRKRLNKPRANVDRQLQALHILGVVTVFESDHFDRPRCYYSLAEDIDPACLLMPEKSSDAHMHTKECVTVTPPNHHTPTDIPGTNGQVSEPLCEFCDRPMMHPTSIERRYCERCHLDRTHQGDDAQRSTS